MTSEKMMNTSYFFKVKFIAYLVLFTGSMYSQQIDDNEKNWDNQIYLANKVTWGGDQWKYSGELHVRLEDNMRSLDRWYMEGVATYLISKKFEIVPDFRFTIKPDQMEFRPGFGVFYKRLVKDFQFVHQIKWQIDMGLSEGNKDNGLRYGLFINHKINDKLFSSFGSGIFYRWRDDFKGFQFVRFGPSIGYVLNQKHTLNFSYFLSAENNGNFWEWSGIPVIQLIININRDYIYVPAKYFSY